jgi:hypothetical protein
METPLHLGQSLQESRGASGPNDPRCLCPVRLAYGLGSRIECEVGCALVVIAAELWGLLRSSPTQVRQMLASPLCHRAPGRETARWLL